MMKKYKDLENGSLDVLNAIDTLKGTNSLNVTGAILNVKRRNNAIADNFVQIARWLGLKASSG